MRHTVALTYFPDDLWATYWSQGDSAGPRHKSFRFSAFFAKKKKWKWIDPTRFTGFRNYKYTKQCINEAVDHLYELEERELNDNVDKFSVFFIIAMACKFLNVLHRSTLQTHCDIELLRESTCKQRVYVYFFLYENENNFGSFNQL